MGTRNSIIRLPFSCEGKETIAELAVMLLSSEWPLSAKGILYRIRGQHMNDVSQQGVYKAIKKLHSSQVLERNGKYYKLNQGWLKRLHKFSTEVSRAYSENQTHLEGLP